MPSPTKRFLSFRNPYSETTSTVDLIDVRAGSSVKDWQNRMARGLDCSTTYSRETRKVFVKSSGNWSWNWRDRPNSSYPWTYRTAYGFGHIAPGPISTSTIVPVSVDNAAKSKFIKHLNAVQKSMDGGVALLEIRKTLDQLRHPLLSLRKSIDDYFPRVTKRVSELSVINGKRRRNANAATRKRAIVSMLTGTYLEWVFGVQPTVQDIKGLCQALDRMSGRALDVARVSGKESWGEIISDTVEYENSQWVLAGQGQFGPTQVAQVKVRRSGFINGKVRYSASVAVESPESSFPRELGLTPRDFLPSVWDLLPWSWAVDYAFNVGSVIDAACAAYGSVKWCNQAITRTVTETWDTGGTLRRTFIPSFNFEDLGKGLDIPSIVQIESKTYSRQPITADFVSFVPRFTLNAPDPVKLLNLAAAVWQSNKVSKDLDRLIRNG